MKNNALEKWKSAGAVSADGRAIDAVMARISQIEKQRMGSRPPARLIVGLDLTQSREHSLEHARIATAAMFDAIKSIGAVAVKLVYYRGMKCRASEWHDDPGVLSELMGQLSCESGYTKIARLLRLALDEPYKISGIVFVGDHCEDDPDELMGLAHALGQRSVPMWLFHECSDQDPRSMDAKPLFTRMAEASGGVYVEFKTDSGAVLREVLSSVAAFAAGGVAGVKQVAAAKTPEARQLQGWLLLLGPAGGNGEQGSE